MNYYFTFGSDPQFPYEHGYVKVIASDQREAVALFNKKYSPRKESGLVNCAFIYNQGEYESAVRRLKEANLTLMYAVFTHCWDVINEKD